MFSQMLVKCSLGQYLHQSMTQTDKPDLSQFTMENYTTITKYRNAYYTFHMPVSLALLMTGVDDVETHRQAKNILLEMGEFFQIQVRLFYWFKIDYTYYRICILCLIYLQSKGNKSLKKI